VRLDPSEGAGAFHAGEAACGLCGEITVRRQLSFHREKGRTCSDICF
jgi:hypothetical protein